MGETRPLYRVVVNCRTEMLASHVIHHAGRVTCFINHHCSVGSSVQVEYTINHKAYCHTRHVWQQYWNPCLSLLLITTLGSHVAHGTLCVSVRVILVTAKQALHRQKIQTVEEMTNEEAIDTGNRAAKNKNEAIPGPMTKSSTCKMKQ